MSKFKVNIIDIKLLKKIRHWYTTYIFNISSILNFIRVIFVKAQTVGINILKKIGYWCSIFIFNLPSAADMEAAPIEALARLQARGSRIVPEGIRNAA